MSEASAQGGVIEGLLESLTVKLHAFSVCDIAEGIELLVEPKDEVLIHYVLAGAGSLQCSDGDVLPFTADSILLVPPGLSQNIIARPPAVQQLRAEDHCEMTVEGLYHYDAAGGRPGDVRMVCATLSATYNGTLDLFDAVTEAIVDNVEGVGAVRTVLEMLMAERSAPSLGTRLVAESLMKLALVLLVRDNLSRQEERSPFFAARADHRLTNVVSLVVSNPSAALTLLDLANAAGMSRSAFSKAFQQTFREPPMEFVRRSRLQQASQMLRNTNLPIKVIAARVGFASRSHFSRAFRAMHGADPTEYRLKPSREMRD